MGAAMASIEDVARDFTALLRAGQFEEAGRRFWASDIHIFEPQQQAGVLAARVRFGSSRLEDIGIDGPFVTGDQFALFLDLVLVDPANGRRHPFSEIALYTVRGGQIAEERHFYE